MFEFMQIALIVIVFIILSIVGYNLLDRASPKEAPAADIKAVATMVPSEVSRSVTPSARSPVKMTQTSPILPKPKESPTSASSPALQTAFITQFDLPQPSPSASAQFNLSPITVNPAPVNVKIDSVTPSEGNSGAEIVLRGSGFGTHANKVRFYGPSVYELSGEGIMSWSDNEIKTYVLPSVKGDYQIEVESADGVRSNQISFKVIAGIPVILSMPYAVVPTQQITIRGEEFGAITGVINLFGPSPSEQKAVPPLAENCQISSWSDTQIRCTLPASLSVGSEYRVSLVTSDGRSAFSWFIKVYENRIYYPVQESSKTN